MQAGGLWWAWTRVFSSSIWDTEAYRKLQMRLGMHWNPCQKKRQNTCQRECQNRRQTGRGCQRECQHRCQIECQNECFASQRCALFHISSPSRWLCICRFGEPTFRLSMATKHWKNTVLRNFLLFMYLDLPSSAFLFSDLLSSSLVFSDCPPHCCCICPFCRNLTCKLPSKVFEYKAQVRMADHHDWCLVSLWRQIAVVQQGWLQNPR